MTEIIITAGVGAITTFLGTFTSWILAKRKYNSEVDNNLINNMKNSLEFYEKLSNDNKARLDEVLIRNKDLEQEVHELKKQVFDLMAVICTDLTCQLRKIDTKVTKDGIKSKEDI